MTTKRINTAVWVESRQRWQINVQKEGVRKTFTSSIPGRAGQREANTKADEWLQHCVVSKSYKIEQVFNEYLASCKELMSTTQYNHNRSAGAAWIIPYLGKKKLQNLCDWDIQVMLDKAAALGRSKKTIQGIKAMTFQFLKYCRRRKLTSYIPDDVKIPASARLKGRKVLQPADLTVFMTEDTTLYKGKRIKEEYIHAFRFQVLTGLRPGELRGLRVEDVDGERISVKRSINVYGEETRGKNENAVRSFVLSDLALKELEAQFREYPSKSGYIFELPSPTAYRERWQKYCESNGLTVTTPYELRHSFVSIVKTLPIGMIKGLVGHSTSMDTLGIYAHVLSGEDTDAAQEVNGVFLRLVEGGKMEKQA